MLHVVFVKFCSLVCSILHRNYYKIQRLTKVTDPFFGVNVNNSFTKYKQNLNFFKQLINTTHLTVCV